jgi:hypothetical protein
MFYLLIFLGGVFVLGKLLVIILEHKADRARHFCALCGEELSPPPSGLWSECSGWKCENCGAWGDDTSSTISLPQSCRQATRQAVVKQVEELRRARKKKV